MNNLTFEARVGADRVVHLPDEIPVGSLVRIQVDPVPSDALIEEYRPLTEIGRLALAARKAYIESGGRLLTADEINEEVRRRRGGLSGE